MESTINKIISPNQMIKVFDSGLINIRFYEPLNPVDEKDFDKEAEYKIIIRHNENYNAKRLFDATIEEVNSVFYNLKHGDFISFDDPRSFDSREASGYIEIKEQMGKVVNMDGQQLEVKKLVNLKKINIYCEANCESHQGKVKRVSVHGGKDWEASRDWGEFNYCSSAIKKDKDSGFIIKKLA